MRNSYSKTEEDMKWKLLRLFFDEETSLLLDELRFFTKIEDPARIIRLGLRYLKRAYQELQKDRSVISIDEDYLEKTRFYFPRDGEPDIDEIDESFCLGEEESQVSGERPPLQAHVEGDAQEAPESPVDISSWRMKKNKGMGKLLRGPWNNKKD